MFSVYHLGLKDPIGSSFLGKTDSPTLATIAHSSSSRMGPPKVLIGRHPHWNVSWCRSCLGDHVVKTSRCNSLINIEGAISGLISWSPGS